MYIYILLLLLLLSISISKILSLSISKMITDKKIIVDTFIARKFTPINNLFGLTSNCHYQTIVGSEALRTKVLGVYPRYFKTKRERYMTDDYDFFDVDYADPNSLILPNDENNSKYIGEDKGLVIVLHGLESNTEGAYHLGFTNDLSQLVGLLHKRNPKRKMYLSGFSL